MKIKKDNVLIYGAGVAGAQIVNKEIFNNYRIKGFIDDDDSKIGEKLNGISIIGKSEIEHYIKNLKINKIIIAIPSIKEDKLNGIIDFISDFNVKIEILPRIFSRDGKIFEDLLIPINLESLIGRTPINPKRDLLLQDIEDKNILITGAGGSIGTVIAQIASENNPKSITLVDNSEFALYKIDKTINEISHGKFEITSKVCDISREEDIKDIFKFNSFDTIYHSAAYKHVPILENNIVQAARNNIIGTFNLIEAAKKDKSKKFVLISTDKAVRPTNVMGATKRFCELLLQCQDNKGVIFTMVRFGNVLGSSGSVIPLFKKQIAAGGPLTVTSKKATRYFMTIKEASELVIQAASMAKGGEVFLLDMGSPVNIYELAQKMITAYGYSNNCDDDKYIKIEITGLRPGEKTVEELLVGNNQEQTQHKNIFMSNEPHFSLKKMNSKYELIKSAIENIDSQIILKILRETVDGYT
tara:strand:- start:5714 stop:7123 length:1410 start_codon:yes stop_codon:yes gene_type:complete